MPTSWAAAEEALRDERRRVLATLVRVTGDLQVAEDAVQEASIAALTAWRRDGVPAEPRAWLTTTARRRAVDLLRREAARSGKEAEAVRLESLRGGALPPRWRVRDDLLRLVFTCCHPALSVEAQVALALRTLCGLTTGEVARALLVPEPTMAKRLVRARQKIRLAGIPYRIPDDAELPDRLAGVTATVYLLYNEGYVATAGERHVRPDVAAEAVRLARLLVELLPDEVSLRGLLALLLLQEARAPARLSPGGDVVLLADQDRSRWDRALVAEGVLLVVDAVRRSPQRPDRYVVQAAIAACHDLAPSPGRTDWDAVVSWYDVLTSIDPSPVVLLNRAAAVAERDGAAAALRLVDAVDGLAQYVPWQASRAVLLERLGRFGEAAAAYRAALVLDMTAPQRRHLAARLRDCVPLVPPAPE